MSIIVKAIEYELVLLDVNLPEMDGVSLCEKMRSQNYTTPILLMTAKNASQDRILGLDAGADDYLTKPLDLEELNARVRALSRRGEVATTSVLDINGLTLDPSSCKVSYHQQPIKVTAKEYSLLEIFLRNPAIPTVVLSDTNSLSDRVALSRAGARSIIAKPAMPSVIWQTTIRLIKQNQTTTASILIVDDDPIFLDAVRSILEPWGIKVSILAEPLRFWQVLQTTQPDLIILDVEMPEINGIELCQALRSDPDWQELPVLFLTARQDAKTIQQIFEIGADDYISKPVIGAELVTRINNRLDRSRLLHNLTTQDRLTGLTNRTQSSREIERLLQQAKDLNRPFCLAVLKMSELQQINLKYGHIMGDRILAQWGKVIQAAFGNDEVTAYWGNGDFVIGMSSLDKTQGKEHLAELVTILRKQVFTSPEGDKFQVNFSCAIAEFIKDGQTLHSLYQSCVGY